MTDSRNKYKTLSSRIAYQNKWITVREDTIIHPNGEQGLYGVVVTNPSVFVVALTDKDEVCLVSQFRYPTQMYSIEIPAGGSENQDPLIAAQRELLEESGFVAKRWDKVGTLQMLNGLLSEIGTVFLARELTRESVQLDSFDAISEMKLVPLAEVLTMIKNGEITDSPAISALMQTLLFLGKI